MLKVVGSLLLGAAVVLPAPAALADDVALLIANLEGAGFPRAGDINKELSSVASAYREAGFNLISGTNLSADEMRDALKRFESASRSADKVIVHFVGAMLPVGGEMHFKPSRYQSGSLVDSDYATPSVDLIYDLLEHRPGKNALILASSTSNLPEKLSDGDHIPNGLLVMIGNGFDTNRAVRDHFLKGKSTGAAMAKRRAISAIGFVSDLPFVSQNVRPVAAPQSNNNSNTAAQNALEEMRVWREATQIGSREALQAYMGRYPNGLFKNEAQARMDALAPQVPLEQTIENALNLNRDARRGIQRNLTVLGFDTRGVDGVLGRGSRTALSNWQRSQGFRATGYIDGAQLRILTQQGRAKAEADRATREREDLNLWQQTGSGNNEQGLQTYLAQFPEGIFAAQARAALERANQQRQQQSNQRFIDRENRLNLVPKTRALVEQRLAGLGYQVGPVDGTFTDQTRIAIKQFQQKARLEATGFLDNQTVTKLVASIFQ